jgi:hypothetical protein
VPTQGPSSTIQGLQRIAKLDTYQPGTLPERAYKRVAIDGEFEGDIGSIEAIPEGIFQSPERPHKPVRSYAMASTASQLADTDQFSVPRMSQLGFDVNWDANEPST